MTEKQKFWMKVYVAAIRKGYGNEMALKLADAAVQDLSAMLERWHETLP